MAGDTSLTVIGNLTHAPELKYTPAGVPVANFTVAATPRYFDREAGQWKDGDALFLRCNLWREAAENLAESDLPRGARVIVTGRLKQRSYQTAEGDKRTVVELTVDEMGPSNRFATTKVTRVSRNGKTVRQSTTTVTDEDPWKNSETVPEPAFAGAGAGAYSDEPPF